MADGDALEAKDLVAHGKMKPCALGSRQGGAVVKAIAGIFACKMSLNHVGEPLGARARLPADRPAKA